MSDERCEKTDLLPADCSHCRGLDEAHDMSMKSKPDRSVGFIASYPGFCDFCDGPIEMGQMICYHPESFGYVHVSCASNRERTTP